MKMTRNQCLKSMFAVAALLALCTLAGTAHADPIQFSLTGTSDSTKYGYTSGQSYTFNWIVNSGFTNTPDSFFIGGTDNFWADETVYEAPLFSDVSGDGLSGAWQRPVVSGFDPNSYIGVLNDSGTHKLSLYAGSDSVYSIGLQADGTALYALRGFAVEVGNIFSFPGSYTDPNVYFASYTGAYTVNGGNIILYAVNIDIISFTPTSLTISTIPEPSTALLTGLGLVALVLHPRRRRSFGTNGETR